MAGYRCVSCGNIFPFSELILSCPLCGSNVEVVYEYESLKEDAVKAFSQKEGRMWKYRPLLPLLHDRNIISLGEGGTPLCRSRRLTEVLGVRSEVFLKNETMNPTGSFLDRGSSVLISRCVELGRKTLVCMTTGNMGASLSAYAARAGLTCINFIPKVVELGKLYQTVIYGGKIVWCEDVEHALSKALKACNENVFPALPNNPVFLEGLKTTGFEIIEQMGRETPDFIIVPIGNGGHIGMIWKGFRELELLGLVDELPRLIGVQTARCAPILGVIGGIVRGGRSIGKIAVDIAVRRPLNISIAVRAIRESGGIAIAVSDEEMLEGVSVLAKSEGLFVEPAAASTIAALRALHDEGILEKGDRIVCVLTGAGLKDPFTARELVKKVREIGPVLRELEGMEARKLGETKMQILRILRKKESYGYEIWKELRSAGKRISIPTVYQHLAELESMGLIERKLGTLGGHGRGRKRTIYRITEAGLELLGSSPDSGNT